MIVNPGIRRAGGSLQARQSVLPCTASITTPVDSTVTIPDWIVYCSSGSIEIDSVAAGAGIVVVNGVWRLT
jgi:hypothetical protein